MSFHANPHRRRLTIVLLLIAGSLGCTPFGPFFYLFGPSPDSERIPASGYALYEKARQDKHKSEIKLVILPYKSRSVPADYTGADTKLANAFVKELTNKFRENREHITIVPIHDLEKFKQEHPEWKTMETKAIGEYFHADYVLDMELSSLSLYDRKSRQQFLLGNIRVYLSLKDVDKDGEEPAFQTEYTRQFPHLGARPVDADSSATTFQQEFFQAAALEMTWLLTKHTSKEDQALKD